MLGPIGLGYDRASDQLVVQLEELVPVDEEGEPIDERTSGHVRLYVTRSQATAFCDHADQVVAAGRPSCRGAPSRSIPTATRAHA